MRKLALAALAVAFVFLGPHPAKACGDKLLAMTRSIGLFKAYVPWKSASILIYQGHAGSLLRDKQFQSSLKAAGHKIEIVDSESQIDPKLSTGKYDLVLAEIRDASALRQRLSSLRSGAAVLPILSKPTKNELAEAEKQYGVVMTIPAVFTQNLEAIDRMMKSRAHSSS